MGAKAAGGEAEKVFLYAGRQRWAPAEAGQGAEWNLNAAALFPSAAKTPAGKRNRKSMSRPFCYTVSYRKIFTVFSAGLIDKLS